MAGITTIVAVVALFIGLLAMWLVTESVKKIEKRTQKLIEIHIKGLRQSVIELDEVVAEQKNGQEAIVNRVRDVVRNRETADVEIAALRKEIDAITQALGSGAKKPAKNGSPASRTGRN